MGLKVKIKVTDTETGEVEYLSEETFFDDEIGRCGSSFHVEKRAKQEMIPISGNGHSVIDAILDFAKNLYCFRRGEKDYFEDKEKHPV
ncbi:hypothetical protein KJ603_00820 [Patescibacteria group bacterium]|nr:hypothetical protein [Patescibacteria group bacterium]